MRITPHVAASLLGLLLGTTSLGAADNVPPPGFTALFNGKDFSGWRQSAAKPNQYLEAPACWTVEDGAIRFAKDAKRQGGHLWTEKSYTNFELHIDWMFHGRGTTGLFTSPAHIKIWDVERAKPGSWQFTGSGSLGYGDNMVRPLKKADKPLGQWNHFRIVVQGDAPAKAGKKPTASGTISIWLNGELIIDRQPRNVRSAPLGLQDHSTEVWFKNIYIKELAE
jgi:hypothetical protein